MDSTRSQTTGASKHAESGAAAVSSRDPAQAAAGMLSARKPVWILGPWQDIVLFVGTPLLILPAFGIASIGLTVEHIALYVAAFGALGHHVPGMMRAYGDKSLFQRFKLRFISAPIFLGVACAVSAKQNFTVLTLIAVIWGVWHGLMQTYGFLRIYDAKVGSFARITRQLDLAMCIAWFGAGMILSPYRLSTLLDKYYVHCAGPLPLWFSIEGFQRVWLWFTVAVTAAYILNIVRQLISREAVNPVKIVLMATSCGFWWYTQVTVVNPLVGVALFEVFHDVQYLSIVWVFNRGRAEKDPNAGSFTRFLFRRSGALIGVYVALVFGYGTLGLVAQGFSLDTVNHAFQGLLVASGLLHFYYDGFIWKIREKQMGDTLGLKAAPAGRSWLPDWKGLSHVGKWAVVVVPALLLVISEQRSETTRLERSAVLAGLLSRSPDAQFRHGEALVAHQRYEEALGYYLRAVDLNPGHTEANNNAGILLAGQGKIGDARACFERALAANPHHADALVNLGLVYEEQGRFTEAIELYERALKRKPGHVKAQQNLDHVQRQTGESDAVSLNDRGVALAERGQTAQAIAAFRKAVNVDPGFFEARNNLGLALALSGQPAEAVAEFRKALEINPSSLPARLSLIAALGQLGRLEDARVECERTIAEAPWFAPAHNMLGLIAEASGRPAEALDHFRKAMELAPDYPEARGHYERLSRGKSSDAAEAPAAPSRP